MEMIVGISTELDDSRCVKYVIRGSACGVSSEGIIDERVGSGSDAAHYHQQ